ncbi:hypothetical protein JL720_504 [Aureococcus anophagefferens]|nr:hypothetical protein JL720_504 [Aureococcus anophagefferens]
MARKASTLLALANVASALSAVPRSGLSLTKALAPELLDFGEASSRDAADTKVLNFASPSEIEAAFAGAGVPIGLDGAAGHEDGHLLTACRTALEYSVRTRHPLFLNQLYGGVDDAALAGEWLVAACNTNAHTYEVAPVFTLVERAVIKRVGELVGWEGACDGLTTPGGSASNLYGMHMAAHAADPGRRTRGAAGGPALCAFAMDDARAAGKTPFFVGSTAGTTVRGAFDDLEEVQAVVDECDEPVWHHVDGSWGGAALWSPALKATWLAGVEKADSMAVNPHKLMNAAISCAVFVTSPARDGALAGTNGAQASYLFQPDKENGDLDTGDKTIQCGRKPDAFKLWLMWKALGDDGMRARVERCVALADHAVEAIKRREADDGALELVMAPHSFTNVLFRVVPKHLRRATRRAAVERSPEDLAALAKAQPFVKSAMQRDGDALIGFQAYGEAQYGNEEINFFRMVVAQGDLLTTELLDHTLDTMVKHADAFEAH